MAGYYHVRGADGVLDPLFSKAMVLDIGQAVQVKTWNADGSARVAYRGSTWNAELESPAVSRTAPLYICATRGSVLVLSDRRPG